MFTMGTEGQRDRGTEGQMDKDAEGGGTERWREGKKGDGGTKGVGTEGRREAGSIQVWELARPGRPLRVLEGHEQRVTALDTR